jgi:hypothetical protein
MKLISNPARGIPATAPQIKGIVQQTALTVELTKFGRFCLELRPK